MCEFCKNIGISETIDGKYGNMSMWVDENDLVIDAPYLQDVFTIKYCPMCGKRLDDVEA